MFASHIYIEGFHSDFTLALIEAFKTFHDEIYTKVVNETMVSVGVSDLIRHNLKNLQ